MPGNFGTTHLQAQARRRFIWSLNHLRPWLILKACKRFDHHLPTLHSKRQIRSRSTRKRRQRQHIPNDARHLQARMGIGPSLLRWPVRTSIQFKSNRGNVICQQLSSSWLPLQLPSKNCKQASHRIWMPLLRATFKKHWGNPLLSQA